MEEEPKETNEGQEAEGKGIPMKWILYVVLAYAFFQTAYFWWQMRGE